jgi:hypothetical protein
LSYEPSWSWSYGSWIYNYLCNRCLSLLMLWVRISMRAMCTTVCAKVCQWLATGLWFSPDPPVSSTNKTDRHDITEVLLKVAFKTIKQTTNNEGCPWCYPFKCKVLFSSGVWKYVMKSIKTNPNSAKGPNQGKIVNKLQYMLLTTLELTWLYFFRKKPDMKFIILVSNLKEISPSVFSWKKEYIKNYDAILL